MMPITQITQRLLDYVDGIQQLTEANFFTGHYDNLRNEYRKRFQFGTPVLYKVFVDTEVKSRTNCEKRAVQRERIENFCETFFNQEG